MHYDAVLWDFDGTLVDTSEGIFASLRHAFAQLGLDAPEQKTLEKFIGPPLIVSFQTHAGLERALAERAIWIFRDDYEKEGLYRSRVYDGLTQLNRKLKARGIKTGVATLKPEIMAKRLLEHFGIETLFDTCVGNSADEMGTLTKAQLVAMALENLGCLDRNRAVLIGDTAYDAQGAREAGVDFIPVAYGFGGAEDGGWAGEFPRLARNAADIEKFLLSD